MNKQEFVCDKNETGLFLGLRILFPFSPPLMSKAETEDFQAERIFDLATVCCEV